MVRSFRLSLFLLCCVYDSWILLLSGPDCSRDFLCVPSLFSLGFGVLVVVFCSGLVAASLVELDLVFVL